MFACVNPSSFAFFAIFALMGEHWSGFSSGDAHPNIPCALPSLDRFWMYLDVDKNPFTWFLNQGEQLPEL